MNLLIRRRMMMASVEEEPNGFKDSASVGLGRTVASMADGILSITNWASANANRMVLPFKKPIEIKSGDTVRILVKRKSGSMSGVVFAYGILGSWTAVNNQTWGTGATPLDKTATATSNITASSLILRQNTAVRTYTNYKVTINIYVNGVLVI